MIWIIGSDGMLGRELCEVFKESNVPFVGTDKDVSILEPDTLKQFAFELKPDWIVNCSGYTAVDKAETDKDTAFAINAEGVKNMISPLFIYPPITFLTEQAVSPFQRKLLYLLSGCMERVNLPAKTRSENFIKNTLLSVLHGSMDSTDRTLSTPCLS